MTLNFKIDLFSQKKRELTLSSGGFG